MKNDFRIFDLFDFGWNYYSRAVERSVKAGVLEPGTEPETCVDGALIAALTVPGGAAGVAFATVAGTALLGTGLGTPVGGALLLGAQVVGAVVGPLGLPLGLVNGGHALKGVFHDVRRILKGASKETTDRSKRGGEANHPRTGYQKGREISCNND